MVAKPGVVNGELRGVAHDPANVAQVIMPRKAQRKLDDKSLLEHIDDILARVTHSFTDEQILKVAPKDRAIMMGILIDKRQLLRGQPTSIMTVEDRRGMAELAQAMMAELERRTINVTPKVIQEARV